MLFNRRFRQIGLFALPYQLVFEALAPVIECAGYLVLVLTIALDILSGPALLEFLALAAAVNLALSTLSVLLCIQSTRASAGEVQGLSLFRYRLRDVVVLLVAGFVSNLGYRQYLVAWQLKGLYDFLKGKQGWDKFARKGFAPRAT
jgi:hypothetical protein